MKLTEWFGPDVRPTIVGTYEFEDLPWPFHYFDGEKWLGAWRSAEEVDPSDKEAQHDGYMDMQRWRGLAEKPE